VENGENSPLVLDSKRINPRFRSLSSSVSAPRLVLIKASDQEVRRLGRRIMEREIITERLRGDQNIECISSRRTRYAVLDFFREQAIVLRSGQRGNRI
jgi:hypothetical protein